MVTGPEWAKLQTRGLHRTLDSYQTLALEGWLIRQVYGGSNFGREWGPRYWTVDACSKPRTDDRYSCKQRIRMILTRCGDQTPIGTIRELVWLQTIKWVRADQEEE